MRHQKLIAASIFLLSSALLSTSLTAQTPSPPAQPAQTKPAQPSTAASSPCLTTPQPNQPAPLRSIIQKSAQASSISEPSIHAGEAPSIPIPMSVISVAPPSNTSANDTPQSITPSQEPIAEPVSPAHEEITSSGNSVGQANPPDASPVVDEAPSMPGTPSGQPPPVSTSLAAEAPHAMPVEGAAYIRPVPAPLVKKKPEVCGRSPPSPSASSLIHLAQAWRSPRRSPAASTSAPASTS